MQTVRNLDALQTALTALRRDGHSLALVPTMGALHAGHLSLVEIARDRADRVAVSIFVNPAQFGPNEDLARYPRQEAQDGALLEEAGAQLLWLPDVETMYPQGFATSVHVARLGDRLCGAARPGHFDGVATVVAKLFAQLRPDIAVFGEKDWQQLAIVRRMNADLNLGVDVVGAPIVRDADGLALSSRNAYLSASERQAALALPNALEQAAHDIAEGGGVAAALAAAIASLKAAGFDPVDYVELVDAATLEPMDRLDRAARILAAARIGTTRLIDNRPVAPTK